MSLLSCSLEWAQKGTLQSNYEAAGIAVNPNKIGEKLGKRGDIAELVKVKDGKVVALDEADDDPDDEEIADGEDNQCHILLGGGGGIIVVGYLPPLCPLVVLPHSISGEGFFWGDVWCPLKSCLQFYLLTSYSRL